MHCLKCWELAEEANCLKEKSGTKPMDWNTFLIELPENLPRVCRKVLRGFAIEVLRETPAEDFPFKEWFDFFATSQDWEAVELAAEKMEATAETKEEKSEYERVKEMIDRKWRRFAKKAVMQR